MTQWQSRWRVFVALGLGIAILLAQRAGAADDRRCFTETGQCIEGRIREFWEQHGGLYVFGLPIAAQGEQIVEDRRLQAQWFERTRLELHPEQARPYDVLIGRLGAEVLAQADQDWRSFPQSAPQAGCRFFAETGHNVCSDILQTWRANGLEFDGKRGTSEAESLALFGLPLSDLREETFVDGRTYAVQWFERARFELHPENAPPYHVLLGLLGSTAQQRLHATPTLTPTDTAMPTPLPESTQKPRPRPRPTARPTVTPKPAPTVKPTLPPYPIQ
jgi:hypothetical protein